VDERQVTEELLHHLRDAVKCRLMSDVPLGAFLSGGIDSATVVALMSELGSGPVKTFSIGFGEEEYNELPYARLVAQRFATEHHEFVVTPQVHDILPKLVWHYNEPFADPSAIPTYYLSQLTREHVTVALNGDAATKASRGTAATSRSAGPRRSSRCRCRCGRPRSRRRGCGRRWRRCRIACRRGSK
jgi:asparagine synthase (glutamine-hydrolysing)